MPDAVLNGAALSLQSSTGKAQWIHLLAAGSQNGRDGRGPFEAGNPRSVIARSFAAVSGGVIPIDYEHATDLRAPKGEEAPAAGWISKMEARNDGIWGYAEWTPRGGQAVKDREYRFISPALAHANGQVLAILRASLTNNPNLTLVALNAASARKDAMDPNTLAELRALLGLADDADEAAMLAKARVSLNTAEKPDPARFVPIELFQQTVRELNSVRAGVDRRDAELCVDQAAKEGRILPYMRSWAIDLCMVNKPAFDSFSENIGKSVSALLHGGGIDVARQMDRDRRSKSHAAGDAIAANLGLSDEDVKKFGGAN